MGVIGARRKIAFNEPHLANAIGNPIAGFKSEFAPIKSCVVHFTPVQAGSGDPSPDNVRMISGWTGINITVN